MKNSKDKLRHASSRRVILKDGVVLKFYPALYGYLMHEIARILFYMVHGVYDVSILSPRRRILNEVRGRKILGSMGVRTTEIKRFSLREKYLAEGFEENAITVDDIENSDPLKITKLARKIGMITRLLNEKGYYFIDNRASNWMANRGLIRTDLELFQSSGRNRKFFMFCDILSFISSVQNENVRENFMEGYGKSVNLKFSSLLQFFVSAYIKMTDIIF